MTAELPDWLIVRRGDAPLVVSIPHAGVELARFEPAFVDPWLARKDADWHLDELYDFVDPLDATVLSTKLSRSIIDVNRDPSGASLYPGQATTDLCPTTTFDGEPLYRAGQAPDESAIAERRRLFFDPYHSALGREIARLRERFRRIALFDAHSIRSRIPRLFDGELPMFNLGTNSGASCNPGLRTGGRRSPRRRRKKAWSSTDGSRAAGSHAPTGSRIRASRPCNSSSPAGPICRSPGARRPITGRRRST